jgi:hypothetical protein
MMLAEVAMITIAANPKMAAMTVEASTGVRCSACSIVSAVSRRSTAFAVVDEWLVQGSCIDGIRGEC